MELVSLQLCNFLCFEELDFAFAPSEFTLIKGINGNNDNSSNGAGKTAFLESIYWILFGRPLRKIILDNIIRLGQDQCIGKLTFKLDNTTYCIERYRGKDNKLIVNGELFNQKQLDSLLEGMGIKKNLFILMSYFHSDTGSLASNTPTERAFLIDSVIGSQTFTNAAQLAKRYSREEAIKLDNWKLQQGQLEAHIAACEARLDEFQRKYKELEIIDNQNIKELETKLSKAKGAYNKYVTELNNLQLDISEIESKIRYCDINMTRIQGELDHKKEKLGEVKDTLELLRKSGKCPLCFSTLNNLDTWEQEFQKQIVSLSEEINTLTTSIASWKFQKDDYKQRLSELYELHSELLEQKDHFSSIITSTTFELDNIKQGSIESIKLREKIHSTKEELARLKTQYDGNKSEIHAIQLHKSNFDFWKKGFKLVRQFLIEDVIKLLNSYIKYYLNNLNLDWDVYFTPIIEDKKAELVLEVVGPLGKTTFENCSSGERRRISLICNWAMAELFKAVGGVIVPDFIIYDETFTGLDDSGKNDVYNILRMNIPNRKQVFVIDHDPNLKELFSNAIVVQKEANRSTVYRM